MKKSIKGFFNTLSVAILLGLAVALIAGPVAGQIVTLATAGTYFLPMPGGVLGMNNTNNYSARESFRVARELLVNAFLDKFKGDVNACRQWVNSRKLSQSEIRLEVQLNATSNTFVFGLTSNQNNSNGVQFNTENRLTMQDSLICYEYGIYTGNPGSATDTTWQLKTYGSQPTFAAAAANALNSTFYSHGYFRITANNDVVMPYRGLFNHWYRPQTQQTAAFGPASPEDQIQGSEDGMITNEPNIFLIGSKGYLPQIVLPVNLAAVDAFERAVVIFRGVLAQNSTDVS